MFPGGLAAAILAVALAASGAAHAADALAIQSPETPHTGENGTIVEILSQEDLRQVVAESAGRQQASYLQPLPIMFGFQESVVTAGLAMNAPSGSGDFSATNIQVAGVDEPDHLKTDGKYLYVLSDNVISVVDVWPAEDARTVSRVALDIDGHADSMFLNGDRLVVFYRDVGKTWTIPEFGFVPQTRHVDLAHAMIIDVSDRANPHTVHDYSMEGRFLDARMIGDHVYFVTGSAIDYGDPRLPVLRGDDAVQTPRAFYFDDESSPLSDFVTLVAINVQDGEAHSETFLMGATATFYVSPDNFYLAYQTYGNVWSPGSDHAMQRFAHAVLPELPQGVRDLVSDILDEIDSNPDAWSDISVILQLYYDTLTPDELEALFDSIRDNEAAYDERVPAEPATHTIIHRVSIDGLSVRYEAKGEVPGSLLDQFSMDEHDSRLRVATTADYVHPRGDTLRSNGVFILDASLDMVGYLEGVAPGESIFSARFMGDQMYLVTFRLVDPFFVIDISGDVPRVLGELKLPGFSNYLHPYGDDYVIGVGRDTSADGGWVSTLGVKIAIFDVRDVSDPKVADDYIIGASRNTSSEVVFDHKAFFLDERRNLLAIPIAGHADELGLSRSVGHELMWHGVYVFDLEGGGLDLKGTLPHSVDSYEHQGFRTFYIGDVLYTVSGKHVKMNDIDTLADINMIQIGKSGELVGFLE